MPALSLPAPPFADPVVARAAALAPLPLTESTGSVFHDVVSCLTEQQIHCRSTKRLFERALARAGIERVTPETFGAFATLGLAGVRLSQPRRDALAAAASFFASDRTDWHALPDDDVRQRLAAIPGVGPWTADMVLLYTLGRPDVFPEGDYHLRHAMAALYGIDAGPSARAVRERREIADGWRPHRSLAVRTLLAWRTAPPLL